MVITIGDFLYFNILLNRNEKKISILLLFFSIVTFSQSTESLKIATKKYYEANYLMDFETIVLLSHPLMVQTFGKDLLLEKLDKYYENEEYRLRE